MRVLRWIGGALWVTATTMGHAATPRSYLTLINDGDATVVGVDRSVPNAQHWIALIIGPPLIGGEAGQATVAIATDNGCLDDLRVRYRDQRTLVITGFNVCQHATLHLGQAMRRAQRTSTPVPAASH